MPDLQIDDAIVRFRSKHFHEAAGLNVSDDDAVRMAIEHAYTDMMPRTITGLGRCNGALKRTCVNHLASQITKYFTNVPPESSADFDLVHQRLCTGLLREMNKTLENFGLDQQKYGKSQKIVNMTYKYLFCCKDGCDRREWFAYCHMPIDTVTIRWFLDCDSNQNCQFSWGKMTETAYLRLVRSIRMALSVTGGCSYMGSVLPENPLLADFVIWGLVNDESSSA